MNFSFAPLSDRFLAACIDFIVFIALGFVVSFFIDSFWVTKDAFMLFQLVQMPFAFLLKVFLTIGCMWLYYVVCFFKLGCSFGQKKMNIVVANYYGRAAGIGRVFVRVLASPLYSVFYLLVLLPFFMIYLGYSFWPEMLLIILPLSLLYIPYFPFALLSVFSIFFISSLLSIWFSFSKQGLHDQISRSIVLTNKEGVKNGT